MKILSLNIGKTRAFPWKGGIVETAIFKEPTTKRLRVRQHQISGDEQADLTVHGGQDKAVYSYASEHYGFWRERRPKAKLTYGIFGENLTTEGLDETTVMIGDRFRIGTVLLEAVQPRFPCSKLGLRFQDDSIIREFLQSQRLGIYYAVMEEGEIGVGDSIILEERAANSLPVSEIGRLMVERTDKDGLKRLVALPQLIPHWREYFSERLA